MSAGLGERLARNWTLKVASFALALFLWAVVRAEPSAREALVGVPVIVSVDDGEWTPAGAPDPATVEVRIVGPARDVLRLDRSGISVRVALSGVASRDTVVELRREWVVLPSGAAGVVVEDVLPARVRLSFVRTIAATRPVTPVLRGSLPEGLAFAAPVATSPAVVRLRGPEGRLDAVDSVRTLPLDLSRLSSGGAFDVAIDTVGIADLAPIPGSVNVRLQIEAFERQTLPSVPVAIEVAPDTPGDLVIEPETLEASFGGAASLVSPEALAPVRWVIAADAVRGLAEGQSRRVEVRLVGASPLVAVTPAVDSVTVRR